MIDSHQLSYVNLQAALVRYAIDQKHFSGAFAISNALLDGDLLNTTSYFTNATGLRAYFNYLQTNEPSHQSDYVSFFTKC